MTNQLPELLRLKYIDWQAKSRKNKSLKGFSAYLGVSAQILSMWMNGTRSPGPENIEILVSKLGPQVYDALGIPRPDPRLLTIQERWHHISENLKDQLYDIIRKDQTDDP